MQDILELWLSASLEVQKQLLRRIGRKALLAAIPTEWLADPTMAALKNSRPFNKPKLIANGGKVVPFRSGIKSTDPADSGSVH